MKDYLTILNSHYESVKLSFEDLSKEQYLSNYIFDFTTYDSSVDKLFTSKALEVCEALNNLETLKYISNEENYRWYLIMVNMPFFRERLDWGTSIREAWWDDHIQIDKENSPFGFEPSINNVKEWKKFIDAIITFSSTERV